MRSHSAIRRSRLAFAVLATLGFVQSSALADAAAPAAVVPLASAVPPQDQPIVEPEAEAAADADRLRIGGVFGVGFPRLLAVEGLFKIGRHVALGVEYSLFPEFAVADVSLSMWALAGDVRVFPFGSGFFFGLRAGHQQLDAQTTLTVAQETLAFEGGLGSVFINPRLGFLWTWGSGITFGLDAGLQIPLSSSTSGALALADSAMVPAAAAGVVSDVRRVAKTFGESTLPTIDLVRLGLLL